MALHNVQMWPYMVSPYGERMYTNHAQASSLYYDGLFGRPTEHNNRFRPIMIRNDTNTDNCG